MEVSYAVSQRRACRTLRVARSTVRYERVASDQAALRIRLRDLSGSRVRYGYRRLHTLLLREGWHVNHKRVYRLYTEENLTMRTKTPRRHVSSRNRMHRPPASQANQRWSMDFMSDELFDGRRLRILTVMDEHTRECLAICASRPFRGEDVVRVLERITGGRGCPESIRVDNGPEFTSKTLDQWAYWNGVGLDFIRRGKPTDNAYIESFNGKLRAECLNENWFLSMEDAQAKLDDWRCHYNRFRPHSALGNLAPDEFAETCQKGRTA
jgi:putative transposase